MLLKLFRARLLAVASGGKRKRAVANEAWRRIFDFIATTADQRDRTLERLDLSPGEVRALSSLAADVGKTMQTLATEWRCDASTATWLVDRLEKREFATRRSAPEDRRVKLVSLTALGSRTKRRLQAELYTPPSELLRLDEAQLIALRDAAAHLPTGPWPAPRAAAELRRVRRKRRPLL